MRVGDPGDAGALVEPGPDRFAGLLEQAEQDVAVDHLLDGAAAEVAPHGGHGEVGDVGAGRQHLAARRAGMAPGPGVL